jgi:hypothetical protein
VPSEPTTLLQQACRVYRIAWNMLGSAAAAMEATQEALSGFSGGDLYAVAVDSISSKPRLEGRPAAGGDAADDLRAMLQRLDRKDRGAYVLRVIEQFSAEETAAILRTSPEDVRHRAHRATLLLTGMLTESSRRPT